MRKAIDISKFRKGITKSLDNISLGFHDPDTWISTGSYALNKAISGDFHKGIPLGKVTVFAGESGSGKSFVVSGNIVSNAQKMGIFVVLIDSENALDTDWLEALGVDTSPEKLLKINAAMIDDVAKIIYDFVKEFKADYLPLHKDDRPQVLFVIDSLGMLMTPTDVAQFADGELKGDMGRKPKALKALITNCVNMFGELNIGLVATNHTYASQNAYSPDDKISGGCLVAGTNVRLADGTVKAIEQFEIGDIVETMYGPKPVANKWMYNKETVKITLDDGQVIRCSEEHRFLVDTPEGQIWLEAKDLTPLHFVISK